MAQDLTAGDQRHTDDVVTPWNVTAQSERGVDYEKLIVKFGSTPIDDRVLGKFESVFGTKPHHFLTRGIFFSHRDIDFILDTYSKSGKIYLYTGRGPSSTAMHVGHLLPFIMTAWLQKTLDCPVVIQLTDDEKWACDPSKINCEKARYYAYENARDIIACGFDERKTLIFSNLRVMSHEINLPNLFNTAWQIGIKTTQNQLKAIFGFTGSDNSAKYFFPFIQAAPSFSCTFSDVFSIDPSDSKSRIACLIPCGIDQDPFFRMTRDVAPQLGQLKPSLLHSKFFPSLQGPKSKMSSSVETSAIFLSDTPNVIKNKINKYAFSGGQATIEEHRAKGADCEVDVSFQYLKYFLEDDDKLEDIRNKYSRGEMLTGELKKITIEVVQKLVADHQARRRLISDEIVDRFMRAQKFPRVSNN